MLCICGLRAGVLKDNVFQDRNHYTVTHPFAAQKPAGRRAQKLRFWVCGYGIMIARTQALALAFDFDRNRKRGLVFLDKLDIAGVAFDNCTMQEAVDRCEEFLEEEGCHMVVTPNAEIAYTCMEDPDIRRLVNQAELVIPDGSGVVLGSKLLGTPLREQVAGADLAQNLLPCLEERGDGLFLLGSKPGVAEQAAENLKKRCPKLVISGVHDGYFKDGGKVAQKVRESGARVVYVCLGFPKQEQFIRDYGELMGVRLALGLGGTLDVLAGVVKRAPQVFIKLHVEFLYRLLKEPRRLGRMMRIPKYLWRILLLRMRGRGE